MLFLFINFNECVCEYDLFLGTQFTYTIKGVSMQTLAVTAAAAAAAVVGLT